MLSKKSSTKKVNNKVSGIETKLNSILDKVRPALIRDGGNLELVKYDKKEGIVEIVLQGACAHCPFADITLKHMIEAEIKSQIPEIKKVIAV